jgi:hypothetical protein
MSPGKLLRGIHRALRAFMPVRIAAVAVVMTFPEIPL